MNRIFTLCMMLLLQMVAHAQGINAADYNPENPPGPHEDGYADPWPLVNLTTMPDWVGDTSLTTADNSDVGNHVEAGREVTVRGWARTLGFSFRAWVAGGDTVSREAEYTFTMPARDVNLCAVFDYTPDSPEHPHANVWNKESGELIITDFEPGRLSWQIEEVTRRDPWSSYWELIRNATVAGVASNGDTGNDDWAAFGYAVNMEFLDMSRTSGLGTVTAYCFSGYGNLKTLVLPATTTAIGVEAFRDCKALSEITCFATTPPEFKGELPGEEPSSIIWGESGPWAFNGLTLDNIIVHVPAESVPLYQEARGWSQLMILPITQGVYRLTVSLPQAQSYKNKFLELANNQTGQSQRYVITDATAYTFNNLIRDTRHTLYIKNQRGVVMGTVDGIEIIDKDVQVSFADLKAPRDITLRLTAPDGSAVGTDAFTATWTDRMGNYLGAGATLAGQTENSQVRCRVKLGETLGLQYMAPEDTVYTVSQSGVLAIALKAIPTKEFGGTVIAENGGQPLRGATVTVSQTLNGQFNTTQTARTDADGRWSLTAFDAPTTITAQATDYISHSDTLTIGSLPADTVALRDLTGTVVNLDLYYYPTVAEGVEPSSENYTDYDNVGYTVYDETHGQEVTETALQYPKLVLIDQQLDKGTQLRVTASSLTDQFAPVTTTCQVDSANQAIAAIGITERGRLHAKFSMTDNEQVMGILYDAKGQLVGWSPYDNTELTVNNLTDGQYTLVTMGYNSLFTSVSSLTALAETGLSDALLVKNTVTVQSGRITEITNTTIPTFKEDDFRLTGEETAFTVNKSEVTVGQYVTLKAVVGFKASVDAAADVQLLFDLPEGCEYVQQSMMVGNHGATPQQEGRRLAVSMTDLTQAVRFCVVPTKSGISEPIAYVSFMNNGQRVVQPIGSVAVTAESLTITVPETTARRLLPVTGMAAPQSTVQVYDGDVLVAETTSLGTGYWSAMAELNQPYNLSSHTMYAIVTNSEGMQMQSEVKTVTVNRGSLTPVVTMHLKGTSSEHHKKDFVFDFRTGEVNPKGMKLTDFGEFTLDFNIDFYDQNDMMVNDTTAIRNVKLYVMMEHGEVFSFPLKYSLRYKDWYLATDYNAGNMPVNVDLDYTIVADVAADRQELDDMMEEIKGYYEESRQSLLDVYHAFEKADDTENEAEMTELNELLQVPDPDDATIDRMSVLVRTIVGDSIMDSAASKLQMDLSELDAMHVDENSSDEDLLKANELLNNIYDNWEKTCGQGVNADSLLAAIDQAFEEFDRGMLEIRDSVLSVMSLYCLPDTAELQFPDGDGQYVHPCGDGQYQIITVRNLTTIDVAQLKAEGYVEMPMTDGSSIYCLNDSTRKCCVDTKKMKFYSLEIVSGDVAEARQIIKKEGGGDDEKAKIEPLGVALSLFPTHCVAEWTKLVDDVKSFGESLGQLVGQGWNWDGVVDVAGKGANMFLSTEAIFACLYDHGCRQVSEVVRRIFAKKWNEAAEKYNFAVSEKKGIRENIAEEQARIAERQKARIKLKENNKMLTERLKNPALTEEMAERIKAQIAHNESKVSSIDAARVESTKLLEKYDRKLAKATEKVATSKNALGQIAKKRKEQIEKFKKLFPAKFKPMREFHKKLFGWMSNPPIEALVKASPLCATFLGCATDVAKWVSLYGKCKAKKPCKDAESELEMLINDCGHLTGYHTVTNGGQLAIDGGNFALSLKPSIPFVDTGWWIAKLLDIVSVVYSSWQTTASENDRKGIEARLNALICDHEKEGDKDSGNKAGTLNNNDKDEKNKNNTYNAYRRWPFYRLWYVRDPSGYVYEAVSSNRIEGVRASCYYKEQKEDMYGDLYDDVIFWDAENYEQENPLYTDADGRYAWDVPTGWWQVKYEKEGYETTYSDWLPVPPPQLEVNVGITQLRQPAVKTVGAYKNAIEVEFDKYMAPATLTSENISVTKGGKTVNGTLQLLNAEAGYQKPAEKYASKVAFMPTQPLEFNERVVLTIRRVVESYAGLQMESDFQQEFTVSNDTLPIERDTTQVDSTAMVVATPTASRISGTTVSRGSTVTLSCSTEGATIWYTTDGTCPCDENGTRQRYTAPIVITSHLLLKAYAVKGVMQESEVATFEYFVDGAMTITTSAAGYATFYDSQTNYQLPSGLRAFCVVADQSQKGGIRNVYLDGNVIPKGTAVAIAADKKQQATYTLTSVAEATPYTGENLLHGSDVATTTTADGDCFFYKACYGPAGTALANWFGWYPANKAKGPFRSEAHRAWLAIPKSMSTRGYYGFGDGATAIDEIGTTDSDGWYDLQGRRIEKPRRAGVYIRNRQKRVVK